MRPTARARLATALLLAAPLPALAQALPAAAPAAVAEERVAVPGLRSAAEILVDRWGIPHITAASQDDAYFAQGFNAARDRLWQIDLWRRRGLGLVSEAFGPAYVEQDRAARLFLYRGDMRTEWLSYGNGARRAATRFAEGVNAYIRWARADPARLPAEFRQFGYEPGEWAPEDVVRIRSHGLTRNVQSELRRAQVLCGADAATDTIRQRLDPPDPAPVVPEGLDPCAVPANVLDVFELATRNVPFTSAERRADAGGEGERRLGEAEPYELSTIGSNNWVVAASRTATGRPLLANDPHRAHGTPSLRYVVHLTAPGMDVIGAGEPALPGISIGHNGTVAFGLTIFAMDQEDLLFYETDAADPGTYRYRGRNESMRVVREAIPVRGEAPREVTLKFTRHGPVVLEQADRNRAWAVRSVWLEPGTAPYFGGLDYTRARNVDEFLGAMDRWGAPSENQVYADTAGTIAWVPGGLMPRRPNWDGLLPVPGDGRYEWDGFLDRSEMPASVNPPAGFVNTSNENNLPEGYPAALIGREWSDRSRFERSREVLAATPRLRVEDAQALQMDVVSQHGLRLQRVLAGLRTEDPALRDAIAWIGAWDGRLTEESPQGALMELWSTRHLRPAIVAAAVPEPLRAVVGAGDVRTAVELMERPDARLGADPPGRRDAILAESLRAALADAAARMGADRNAWAWGRVHTVQFDHPMAAWMDEATRARFRVGPMPKAGSGFTVSAATYAPGSFRLTAGASFRMVVDVGAWDNSRVVNTPGQSGDPSTPHYRDLFEAWRTGGYVPMLYSRPAVEGAAERRIALVPG
ncbi:penicillin acylase family protein [Roseomonas nepalensis]|uniref:Penicillin acylase family protein n=1 Tax=Muricoccus nepalensis TaxID=1854500 RepID=A0A502GDE0_9PROT|nr:penicillin acylase family protein [Roseomonas nepalensis]TPG59662.1 penicillin acylase family protein [Roseomonas nepalensis]